METKLLAELAPSVIACYLLLDRVFRFVSERNGRNPQNNIKKLVEQNTEILGELRKMRLEIALLRGEQRRSA